MLKKAGILFATILLFTSIAFSQDGHFDASVNFGGTFTKESDGDGIRQTATEGSEIFGTFRAKVDSKSSLAFTYGHAKDSQIYQSGFDFHVATAMSEYSVAYMLTPVRKGRFEPFLLGGVGALGFKPGTTWVVLPEITPGVPNRAQVTSGATKQTRIGFVYGGGLDYKLPWFTRLGLRFQYRGWIYAAPDFNVTGISTSIPSFHTGARGHIAEPSLGLVFRF